MRQNHSIVLDGTRLDLEIDIKKENSFEISDFFTHYPFVYFKPKDEDIEFFACGAIFYVHHYPDIQSDIDIPIFVIGQNSASNCDFLKQHAFIPQKWVIKKKETYHRFTITSPQDKDLIFKVISSFSSTSKSYAVEKINTIIDLIKNGPLEKCVFAQVQKIDNTHFLSLDDFIKRPHHGTRFFYRFSPSFQFFGSTPEWIYKRCGNDIKIEAIAGTALKEELEKLNEMKIIKEFEVVKEGIKKDLEHDVSKGSFSKIDSYIVHEHLVHRYNVFCGLINDDLTDSSLIKKLHPTPAISGFPKNLALETISKFENFKRGFYSSPVGFYGEKQAYFAVAIRSSLQISTTTCLFSGAGIVKDSNPLLEWHELLEKTLTARQLITQNK